MNDQELHERLQNAIPEPGPGYWTQINSMLADPEIASPSITDITIDSTERDRPRGTRRVRGWPLAFAAAIVLVVGGWALGSRIIDRDNTTDSNAVFAQDILSLDLEDRPGPRQNRDHWQAVYAVWDCTADRDEDGGGWLDAFKSAQDDTGIHSHGDGLISIHPFLERSSGRNATFSHFANEMGISVTADAITLDDGRTLNAGTVCDGEPAVVQMRRWERDLDVRANPSLPPRLILDDFGAERFYNDREVWVIALAPVDAVIPLPPEERLRELDNWLRGPNPLNDLQPDVDVRGDAQAQQLPSGDVYISAQPGMGASELAGDLLAVRLKQITGDPLLEQTIVDGSVRHAATLQSAERVLDLFTFEGTGEFSNCFGVFSAVPNKPSGVSTCLVPNPAPGLGLGNDGLMHHVVVNDAPQDAEWMVVFTDKQKRIVARVVDNIAYAEWSTSFGGTPTRAQLLDRELRQVWAVEDL